MKINKKYLFAFLVLLVIEIAIALFVNDAIVRPFIGDILVVILLYTFIRALLQKPVRFLPIFLFVFASIVEIAQYFKIVNLLNLQYNRFFSTIMGTTFDIRDVFCYLIAAVMLLIWEGIENKKFRSI